MTDPTRVSLALATLNASPILDHFSAASLHALAVRMGDPVPNVDVHELAEGSLVLLTAPSRILFFVERISAGRPLLSPSAPKESADNWVHTDDTADGDSAMSTVPTLFGGTAIFPAMGRHLRLETETERGFYVFSPEMLESLAEDPAWDRAAVAALTERLHKDAVLATAPATRRSGARQRSVVAEAMRIRVVKAGEPLIDFDAPAEELYVISGQGEVSLTRRTAGGEVTYRLGYGAVFGGEALTAGGAETSLVRATAAEDTELLVLPREAIRALLVFHLSSAREGGADWFRLFAASFREIDRNAADLVSFLRGLPLLGGLEASDLYDLLQGADLLRWRLNWPDPEPVNLVPGFGLVLEGELLRVGQRPGHGDATDDPHGLRPECAVRPGECFGLVDMVLGDPVGRVWQARTPARVVFILRHRCLEVLDRLPGFLEPVMALRGLEFAQRALRAELAGPHAEPLAPVVLFQAIGTGTVAQHLPELLEALRLAISRDFGEKACVIHVDPDAGTNVLEARLAEARRDPEVRWVLAYSAPAPRLWSLFSRLVFVHADRRIPFSGLMVRHVPSVFTTILPTDVAVEDSGPPSRNVYPPNRVRLTMPLAGGPQPGSVWLERYRADFSRWARAVTDRRVGVALGGGGAWGYAHLAVLHHMELQEIPVDMVSGASFGSVVGAFYAAEQRAGMEKLMKNGRALNLATKLAFVTYVPLQKFIDRLLAGRRLEDLVIPFFPATTDVVSGSEDYVARGTLGLGVRASGGLAPMMPPTRTAFATWVDGGMVANVPTGVLRQEGARFIVSSNVVPPPESSPRPDLMRGWYGQLLADLNPLARMDSAFASWMTAMATIGEYSASAADVQFDAAQPRALPIDMKGGLKILDNAVSNPAFWDSLKSARDQWGRLRGA